MIFEKILRLFTRKRFVPKEEGNKHTPFKTENFERIQNDKKKTIPKKELQRNSSPQKENIVLPQKTREKVISEKKSNKNTLSKAENVAKFQDLSSSDQEKSLSRLIFHIMQKGGQ